MVGIIEDKYVNAYGADFDVSWIRGGASPYLQDTDADHITTYSDHKSEGHFLFPVSAGSGTINSVKIRLEASQSADSDFTHIDLWVYNGTAWTNVGTVWFTTSYAWYEVDVSAILNSWAKINACEIYVYSHDTDAVTMVIRRGVRRVDYGVPPAAAHRLQCDGLVVIAT